MTVPTADEVFRGYWQYKDAELPPAEHDPLCHFVTTVECEWWGWHELQKEEPKE